MRSLYDDPRMYDAVHGAFADGDELRFYAEAAAGEPVLELGTGTGRLAIPLARAGAAVTGVDLSAAMLALAREKAGATPVTWVEADARGLALGRTFGLVCLPINTLAHFPERADLEALFAAVRAHLAPGGRFALALFNPSLALLDRDPAARTPLGTIADPAGGAPFAWSEAVAYDRATQVNAIRWFFERDGVEAEARLQMRIFFPRELEALLHYNGFVVERCSGDFVGGAFTSASRHQVLVCGPA